VVVLWLRVCNWLFDGFITVSRPLDVDAVETRSINAFFVCSPNGGEYFFFEALRTEESF